MPFFACFQQSFDYLKHQHRQDVGERHSRANSQDRGRKMAHIAVIGGILCELCSKMYARRSNFKVAEAGSALARLEVIMSENVSGLAKFVKIDAALLLTIED